MLSGHLRSQGDPGCWAEACAPGQPTTPLVGTIAAAAPAASGPTPTAHHPPNATPGPLRGGRHVPSSPRTHGASAPWRTPAEPARRWARAWGGAGAGPGTGPGTRQPTRVLGASSFPYTARRQAGATPSPQDMTQASGQPSSSHCAPPSHRPTRTDAGRPHPQRHVLSTPSPHFLTPSQADFRETENRTVSAHRTPLAPVEASLLLQGRLSAGNL